MPKRKAPPLRTLKRMRADAPPQDRDLPALALPPVPTAPAPRSAQYLPANHRATTLDDLRNSCGRYADAAVNEAQANAMQIWLMRAGGEQDLGIPCEVITASTMRCNGSRRIAEGYPSISEGYRGMFTLADLSPDSAAEAQQVCTDVLALWVAAGSPHLANAVQNVRQHINAVFNREAALNRETMA
jgi:hypothetical protein